MACVLIAILGFPVLAASVIARWIVRHLKEKGYAHAKAIGVLSFVISLIAVFVLSAYIFSTKFRFVR